MGGHHRLLGARDPRRGCPLPNRRLWRRGAARDHGHVHILRQLPVLRRGLGCGGTRLHAAAAATGRCAFYCGDVVAEGCCCVCRMGRRGHTPPAYSVCVLCMGAQDGALTREFPPTLLGARFHLTFLFLLLTVTPQRYPSGSR